MNPMPQPAAQRNAELAAARPDSPARTAWDFESLSWLAPKIPLRQVIYILGAGQDTIREQFRLLATRLQDLRQSRPLKTILVTSSLPEEGKTFVALNLAAALSQRDRHKVLLLEADLRRPSCCSSLGLSPVLMSAANSAGGVMGKMIAAQSIIVACAAVGEEGKEGDVFRAVLPHSIALAAIVGGIVFLFAYYGQAWIPVGRVWR